MKEPENFLEVNLLGNAEQQRLLGKIKTLMATAGIDAALLRSNVSLYYLTGRVFRGFIYIDLIHDEPHYFVRRPSCLRDNEKNQLHHIKRPDEIREILHAQGISIPQSTALELDVASYTDCCRLWKSLGLEGTPLNISPVLRQARAVKTDRELEMIRLSGEKQTLVYERIPHVFQEGMTDIEFQIEIERLLRLHGCLGQFRCGGGEMELFMGNVLTGENSDTPSPYDFAMGGEGLNPSLPLGANGTVIRPDYPVMVDMNGNFNGYMTDMTRMYYYGELTDKVKSAIELSIRICKELAQMMVPGTPASALYMRAAEMAQEAGMSEYFMGHRSHAGFVGHGIGIEVNELPVLAPRSRDIIEKGNVIAVEPKFVLPGIGAVGIENTYRVSDNGGVCLTLCQEAPIML